jgi:glutaredoxin-related protein
LCHAAEGKDQELFSNFETCVCLAVAAAQVFVKGEFVGGSDILMEMHNAGELAQLAEELKK